jgi:hypothetical protein
MFRFRETLEGYPVPVLNERVVRAGAGLVFVFGFIAFMNAWLLGNFDPIRVFVVAFLIDFTLRIFVNPQSAFSESALGICIGCKMYTSLHWVNTVAAIIQSPELGEPKRGDLSGVYVYTFKSYSQLMLLD